MENTNQSPLSIADRTRAVQRLGRVLALRGPLLARAIAGSLGPDGNLAPHWRERYERAARDIAANDEIFRPARQWRLISFFFRRMMRAYGLSNFKSTFGRFLAAYEPHNPRYFAALHHVYWRSLQQRDQFGLLETLEEPELGGGDAVVVDGKRVTMDLLQSVDEFYRLVENLGWKQHDDVTVCEIGAGYGRLAHVVLAAMPHAKYQIVDLPESLVLAQYYLTQLFPASSALLYPESVGRDWGTARLAFGLPHQLRELQPGTIDVVVNIYSFMEMSTKQVETYFDAIESLAPRMLFMKQHKHEVNVLEQSLLTAHGYPVREHWQLAYNGTSSLYEDVFESLYRVRQQD